MPELYITLLVSDRMILLLVEHQELASLALRYCQDGIPGKIRWGTKQCYDIVEILAIQVLPIERLTYDPILIDRVFC
jgi:hypothetical protein